MHTTPHLHTTPAAILAANLLGMHPDIRCLSSTCHPHVIFRFSHTSIHANHACCSVAAYQLGMHALSATTGLSLYSIVTVMCHHSLSTPPCHHAIHPHHHPCCFVCALGGHGNGHHLRATQFVMVQCHQFLLAPTWIQRQCLRTWCTWCARLDSSLVLSLVWGHHHSLFTPILLPPGLLQCQRTLWACIRPSRCSTAACACWSS